MKQVNYPDDLESPNDKFFNPQIVKYFLDNAGSQVSEDWATIDGNTILEKYSNIYVKITELTKEVVKKGGKGYFWIISHPDTAALFEAFGNFVSCHNDQIPMGYSMVMCLGTLDKRYRIYSDTSLEPFTFLIGCGFSKKPNNYYCRYKITNVV